MPYKKIKKIVAPILIASLVLPILPSYSVQASTNTFGRIVKVANNSESDSGTVYLYDNPSLSGSSISYANIGSIEDAPILETSENSVKVMINGCVGWISNDAASGIKTISTDQVKNPSYYTAKGGELIHFISSNLEGSGGASIVLGKAPAYLKEGAKYLSYDGNYFYEFNSNNIPSVLNLLVNEYKAGVRTSSANNNRPFYNYYQNLSFRSKTVYTAAELDKYINDNTPENSKLRGLGQVFKDAENAYGVNALLTLAVAMNESARGTSTRALEKNNLFGLKAYDSHENAGETFATPQDSIIDFTKNYLSRGYADPAHPYRYAGGFLGNKNKGVNVKYASDPFWGEKAASYSYQIDKYLSGGISNLRDTNTYQIGMATANNSVVKNDGTLLYNITGDSKFVITNLQKAVINGQEYYEIHPERTTPVGSGGDGSYDWSKGYILASNISFIGKYEPQVEVKFGANRYETAAQLSQSSFNSADTVVIVNGLILADGLTATPIATYYKAPLLLVDKYQIKDTIKNEIKRLGAKNAIIVGGTTVVPKAIENQLFSLGISKITRLGGADRYETALEVAKYIDENMYDVENIVVANGLGEADALSIAPVSGRDKMPILLVKKDRVTDNVYNWLKSEKINNAYVIGGTTVTSDAVLNSINKITAQNIDGNRLGGANRYETNAKIIERFYGDVFDRAYITKGLPLADALTSGPIAAINNSPVILANYTLTENQKGILSNRTTNKVIQVGGQVSSLAVQNLKELLSRNE